jgi:hypothetical protein
MQHMHKNKKIIHIQLVPNEFDMLLFHHVAHILNNKNDN